MADLAYHSPAARVYQADCLETAGDIRPGSVQLLFTSPPYPGLRNCPYSGDVYESWLHARLSAWVPALHPETGVLVLVYKFGRTAAGWFDLRQFELLRDIEIEHGLHILDIYPWDKLNSPPAGSHDRHDRDEWEIVAVFARSPGYYYRPVRRPYSPKTIGKAAAGNLRQASIAGNLGNGHNHLHPAGARQGNVLRISSSADQNRPRVIGGSFPRALPERFIEQHTHPGDIVADPFCGAGTTLVTAVALGRRAIGVDVDATAVETAVNWLESVAGDSDRAGQTHACHQNEATK